MGPLAHSAAALAALAALPVGLLGAALRPGLRTGWRERLGAGPAGAPGAVWVHGASVGEVGAALRLIEGLRGDGIPVVASSMTLTGRGLLRREQPEVPSALAPLDHPWCVAAALRRVAPSLLVLVETELWPSWILAARARGIPVVLVSARLSDRSFPRYRRFARVLRPVLLALHRVGARSDAEARRFVALGLPETHVEVTGDLKLEPPLNSPALAPELAAALGKVPLFVAGSTHEGEEEAALRALQAAEAAGQRAALVLAPRYPERSAAVARLAARAGRPVLRRSAVMGEPLGAGSVLVLDSVGELASLYARADVAFVGGSLVPRGGHNVLEPAHAGRAVLIGPHTENVRDAAELLLACEGAQRVVDPEELARALERALRDPVAWAARGARASEALARHRGAAERTLALIRAARRGQAG